MANPIMKNEFLKIAAIVILKDLKNITDFPPQTG